MKKLIMNGIVISIFMLFGFMLTYKVKSAYTADSTKLTSSIAYDIKTLEEKKKEIQDKNNEILSEIKKIEDREAGYSGLNKELTKYKLLLGIVDAEGPGVIINIKPLIKPLEKSLYISDEEINFLINELYYASAEAISINDNRITSQSGIIKKSNTEILINSNIVKVDEQITIKAIGNTDKILTALRDFDMQTHNALENYKFSIERQDKLKVLKNQQPYKFGDIKQEE